MHNPSLTPHGHFDWPIDELSIGVGEIDGKQFELAVFAHGHAQIGYGLDGDWRIAEIHIDGYATAPGSSMRPREVKIASDHPLYAPIHDALIDVAGRRIEDEAVQQIAMEREA